MGLRVGGLASGLDTAALIEALLTLERRPLQLAEQRKTEIESKQTLFRDLGTKLAALRDAASAIDNLSTGFSGVSFEEEFLAYTATSSDDAVLTAAASSAATPGTTEVTVTKLAQVGRVISGPFSSDTDPITDPFSNVTISHGGENQISVSPATASLRDIADLINTDPNNGGRVRAEVIFDGSDYRMIVSGTNPGVENDLSFFTNIAGEGGGAFVESTTPASDALLTVFGLPITRPTNSIADVVPGVTLELITEGATARVQVARDDEEIESKLQAFVDAYNGVTEFFLANARYDLENETAGALVGDTTSRTIEQRLRRLLVDQREFTNNPFSSLGLIGIGLESDGKLALDSEALKSALTTDATAVRQLLSGDGTLLPEGDGIATAMSRLIDEIVDADPGEDPLNPQLGMLAIRNLSFAPQIADFDRQIERLEDRLEQREQLLVQRFTQLETVLAQLQNQGRALDSFSILRPSP